MAVFEWCVVQRAGLLEEIPDADRWIADVLRSLP